MSPSTARVRMAFLRAGAVTLALVFAAILAFAGSPDGAPAKTVHGASIDAPAPLPVCSVKAEAGPELSSAAARPMRGYCRCSCSFIPNCTTNADCGGGLCLKGPTCC